MFRSVVQKYGVFIFALACFSLALLIQLQWRPVHWVGSFPLQVQLNSEAPIEKAWYATTASEGMARSLQELPETDYLFDPAPNFDGKSFVADVRCYGTQWLFFNNYFQQRYLVLIVQFQDGEMARRIITIPESRNSPRELQVDLPYVRTN